MFHHEWLEGGGESVGVGAGEGVSSCCAIV